MKSKYGQSLWINPIGEIHDMSKLNNAHFHWICQNWRGVSTERRKTNEEYDVPFEMGWIRVVNTKQELQLNINMIRFSTKQKKVVRDIFDENHKRTLYVDVWRENGSDVKYNKLFDDYDDIVNFLSI